MLKKILKINGLVIGILIIMGSFGGFLSGDFIFSVLFLSLGIFLSYKCLPKRMKVAVSDQISTFQPNSKYKYADLIEIERQIEKAIKNKTTGSFNFELSTFTKEKWEYLKGKYPLLELPPNSKIHQYYESNLKYFEELKSKIENEETLCLSEYEEEIIKAFTKQFLPHCHLNIVRPIIIKAPIAGFRFHDYKRKEVKMMLEMDATFQVLDLVREPTNKYDPYAVRVMWEGFCLGYVPRQYSTMVYKAIDESFEIECLLYEYNKTGNLDDRTTIEITIKEV